MKNPGYTDSRSTRTFSKRCAARRVRHIKDFDSVGNFSWYKKLYEQYDICKYNFRVYSRKELIDHLNKKRWNYMDYIIIKHYFDNIDSNVGLIKYITAEFGYMYTDEQKLQYSYRWRMK
jgi:hypothetical protein